MWHTEICSCILYSGLFLCVEMLISKPFFPAVGSQDSSSLLPWGWAGLPRGSARQEDAGRADLMSQAAASLGLALLMEQLLFWGSGSAPVPAAICVTHGAAHKARGDP